MNTTTTRTTTRAPRTTTRRASLVIDAPPAKDKGGARVDRAALKALAGRALGAPTLAAAAAVIRAFALELAPTPTYTLRALAPATWAGRPIKALKRVACYFDVSKKGTRARDLSALSSSAGKQVNYPGWRAYLLETADALELGTSRFSVFALKGNVKLPFASFSTLPGFTCPGAGACLSFCYSYRAWRYPAGFGRQLSNTLLMKHAPHVVRNAFDALPQSITIRLYVDGDFDSASTVKFWFDALKSRPDLNAYGYSKSWDEIVDAGALNSWPNNYVLNLSTGGLVRTIDRAGMLALPITRGGFHTVKIDYRPKGHNGNIGFDRYQDPEYHRAVRAAAKALGILKPFSCPGLCGSCTIGTQACGDRKFDNVEIVNGEH